MVVHSAEKDRQGKGELLPTAAAIAAASVGFYLARTFNYVLFHSLVEVTTSAIGLGAFILVWNARRFLGDDSLTVLGLGYAFSAAIDLVHALAYKGMGVFPGQGADLPTQLWIAARGLQAASLLAAGACAGRRLDARVMIGAHAAAVALLLALVFAGRFPSCFVEGAGLTRFKIASEYVICAALLGALLLFHRSRTRRDAMVQSLVVAALACSVAAELAFTAYRDVYAFPNALGHLLRFAGYYLIYRALIATGLRQPFDLIFRDLKRAEEGLRAAKQDLEEQVRARTAELRASEEQHRGLLERLQVAAVVHAADTRIVICNPRAQQLLNLSAEQLTGKVAGDPEWRLFREDGTAVPVSEDPVHRVLSTGRPVRDAVYRVCRPTGQDDVWVLVNADPVADTAGGVGQVVVSFVDVTERKRAEQERLAHLGFLQSMDQVHRALQGTGLEQMIGDVLGVVLSVFECDRAFLFHPCDPDASILAVPMERCRREYPGALALGLEIPMEEDVARVLRLCLEADGPVRFGPGTQHPLPASAARFYVQCMMVMAVRPKIGKPWQFGIHQCSRARTWTPEEERLLEEIGRRLADALTTFLVLRDLKQSERELERRVADRTAELAAANRELEAFAYSVSHDLRTPLRAIDGYRGLLQRRLEHRLDDPSRRFLDSISQAAVRMGHLIDDLLSFSRMGRVEMAQREVDLGGLVAEVIRELEPEAAGRAIEWRVGALPIVRGDRAMLRVALVNLLSNAVKFTRPRARAEIEIGQRTEPDGAATVFVRDNGVGFDMAHVEKLFGVFQRLHGAEEFEGTGIGLANVRRVIARHGGRTWAECQAGRGATFYFSLPVTTSPPQRMVGSKSPV